MRDGRQRDNRLYIKMHRMTATQADRKADAVRQKTMHMCGADVGFDQ